uniref:Endonuclease-reverse transcriptase n=1 Tax=Echinostoma caproni TaxID=27848 RepID=A0A183A330_9TREM
LGASLEPEYYFKTNPKEIGEKRGNPKPKKDSRKVNRQPTGFQMGAPPDGFKAAISRFEKQEVRIENLARHTQRQLKEIQKPHASYETTLGRTRNVIIHAPEPVISNTAQRIAAEKTLILSVLRNAGCHLKMTWKRAHRLGKWVTPKQDGLPTSRPLLVELRSAKERDFLISKAPVIASTMTNIKIGADNRTRKAVISGPH